MRQASYNRIEGRRYLESRAAGYVPQKQFCFEQALACGITDTAVWYRIKRGLYPGLRRRHINKRVVMVKLAA